jgi:peptide/nickel transport system substrate-binding protein
VPDQFLQFDRNDDYYLGAPILDRVFLTLYQDQETMVAALEAGEIDFVRVLSGDNYRRVQEMPNVGIVGGPAYILQCININTARFPDKRVRQALFYGLDRPALIEGVIGSELATLAEAPSIAGTSWYAEGLPQYTYDPEKAKALLADAGFDLATPIELSYNYEDQTTQNLGAAIQQYWNALGLTNVTVQYYENAVHNPMLAEGEYDVAYDAGGGLGIDPSAALDEFGIGAGGNRTQYENETVDSLLREAQTTMDASERDEMFKQVQEILNDEVPSLVLWEVNRYSGLSNRIANFPWANMGGPEHYYPASHLWAIKAE